MGKQWSFYLAIISVLFLLGGRLIQVQLIDKSYKEFAERNATTMDKVYAPRGYIYDRNGTPCRRTDRQIDRSPGPG